ncbi:O-methyltransferase [Glutamicibacter arilaitensis]|uniref:O-methyltransferase n=1 Tax=Glutamicibacter arilaitensis TaxID=256701 RepID=A0A4Y8TTV4_9MICC|nr:O-methyltransferase [Glutamicibacter arilaitensis]TFH54655.1 O-methyltransferase [Glutamicibacter arilaitensis]
MIHHSADHHAAAVDEYLEQRLGLRIDALEAGREHAHNAGLPRIEVSPAQGKFLQLLVEITGARRVLEIGTLGGYSTSWLAKGVGESGTVISCEFEPLHASIACENLQRAGLSERVEIKLGAAQGSMESLISRKSAPFDLIFIDADKRNNVRYLELAMDLARPGTVVVLDNVVRSGAILDAAADHGTQEADVRGVQDSLQWLRDDPRVSATALQTVGAKGWDGFALARVL